MRIHFSPRILVVLLLLFGFSGVAVANHAWGCYHWKKTSSEVSLLVGDNVTSAWDSYLTEAIGDWNPSKVIQLTKTTGRTKPKPCKGSAGRIEVCNASYGNNGWLGLAQIWVSGCHITQGVSKMNDYYFNQSQYNTAPWRELVMCQEIAHDFGLDHQDENFNNANLGSCMDYTSDPDGPPSNMDPNGHDFTQLESIYNHTDASAFFDPNEAPPAAMFDIELATPAQWGKVVHTSRDGRLQLYELDFGHGYKVFTHVIWAEARTGKGPERSREQQ